MCCAAVSWTAGECRLDFRVERIGLRVEINGATDTQQARLACWARLAEEVTRRSAAAVLAVDKREGGLASPHQWHSLLEELDMDALKARPLAYVGAWPHFTQLEALNFSLLERGFQAQVFDDEAAAERWLRYGEHGRVARPADHFSTKARSNT